MAGFVSATARAAEFLKKGKQDINKALGHKNGKGGKKLSGAKPPTSYKEAAEKSDAE